MVERWMVEVAVDGFEDLYELLNDALGDGKISDYFVIAKTGNE